MGTKQGTSQPGTGYTYGHLARRKASSNPGLGVSAFDCSGTFPHTHGHRCLGGGARTPCQMFPVDRLDAEYDGGWR